LFFPPTEYDLKNDDDWEEVEGDESAENGAAAGVSDGETSDLPGEEGEELESSERSKGKSMIDDLPDVPTKEPSDEGPAAKKRKPSNDGEGL
jgi:O-acetyl-ADP-ribose deacetylase